MKETKRWMAMALAGLFLVGCATESGEGHAFEESTPSPNAQGQTSAGEGSSERKVTVDELASIPLTEQGTWVNAPDGKKWYKNTGTFYNTFDTVIQLISYTESEEQFAQYFELTQKEFERLHKLFDNYHEYEGIVNVATLNREASRAPVKVEKELYDLIAFCLENYDRTLGKVNIALGAPLALWHDAREQANEESEHEEAAEATSESAHSHDELPEPQGQLPNASKLQETGKHTKISDIVLDPKEQTVYLKDPALQLDPGAVAKGYATEMVAKKLQEAGFTHGIISAGGNVKTIGSPVDGRTDWTVGISHPRPEMGQVIATVTVQGTSSMVTSGDYQRYFYVGDKLYHHIIDPETLMPPDRYTSVSVKTQDSALADLLSTTFFLCTPEEAKQVLEHYKEEGIEVIWVDGAMNVTSTDGIREALTLKKE